MSQPLVTVICLTYNQADYVQDMLEGLLMQETDFEVEYIIHDDASTDGTQVILKEYEAKYPDVFRIVYEKENQWSKGVKITQQLLVPMIRGKYVAFCEGDDFWIDRHKLQIQADFLEAHPEYSCVVHNAIMWRCKNNRLDVQNNFDRSRDLEARDVLDRRFPPIATAAKMHRKDAFILEGIFLECREVGDVPTDFFAFTKGKMYYMDRIMSVYRFGADGSWSKRSDRDLKKLLIWRAQFSRFMDQYNQYTDGKYQFYLGVYETRGHHGFVDVLARRKIGSEEFKALMRAAKEELGNGYDRYLNELERMVNIMVLGYEEEFQNAMVELTQSKSIYIYGAGWYGQVVANYFLNNGIPFEGFVVTDTSENKAMMFGKRVYGVEEYSCQKENAVLVMALAVINWEDVLSTLKLYEIDQYICPLYGEFLRERERDI
ncbi:MAG: glycosyltransferase family 2 protein [bacterium]|nr:glycosyltransferase family 2 protein [bacterium]MCM1374650.1 glycosyltransferase family 2 protein [Muribaculum sp.]